MKSKTKFIGIGLIVLLSLSALVLSCTKESFDVDVPESDTYDADTSKLKSGSYLVTVTPSQSIVKIGGCLYFTGKVTTLSGSPVIGCNIGVEDPIKQQSIPYAAKTDAYGKFTYYVEKMCPAVYNNMTGKYKFKFFIGGFIRESIVTVQVNPPTAMKSLSAVNTGLVTYKVQTSINGVVNGTYIIGPGANLNLWSSDKFGTGTFQATILSTDNRILWKAIFDHTMSNNSQNSTFLNPTYRNFSANTTSTINGYSRSRLLAGVGQYYRDYANKEVTVGTAKVKAEQELIHGIATKQEIGINGPSCKTFLGAKAGCRFSCGASAGLQICAALGEPLALTPVTAGCSIKCCVEIATVKCEVGSIGFSTSASIK